MQSLQMLILIACECSGKVRDAFLKNGHEVYSCDIKPCRRPGPHFQQSVTDLLPYRWDMLIGFPPCTHLAVSGAAHFKYKQQEQEEGFNFFMLLMKQHHIPRIALENPIGVVSTLFRPPTQIIQPYYFGEMETKATCLWLKNLPKLQPTQMTDPGEFITLSSGKRMSRRHYESFGDAHQRSVTYNGIARAMADQWNDSNLQPLQN